MFLFRLHFKLSAQDDLFKLNYPQKMNVTICVDDTSRVKVDILTLRMICNVHVSTSRLTAGHNLFTLSYF